MKIKIFLTAIALVMCSANSFSANENKIDTAVVTAKAANVEVFDWGRLMTYYVGESYSTTDSLTAVAIINPGMEIHPPHVHSEEEYLMVLEGQGTWSVKGKDFPAQAGDVLYAAPWDEHGIKNTGVTPLSFVVFKWNPKAVEPAAKPESTVKSK